MTFGITALRKTTFLIIMQCQVSQYFIVMLGVVILSAITRSVIMLSVILLSVTMLNVFILGVTMPECQYA